MRGARLVQWCGLFGVAEGTTRVALSRMVERGELHAADGVVRARGARGDPPARPGLEPRSGPARLGRRVGGSAWSTMGGRAASERAALRDAMRHLRHAEQREGVWCRPDNLPRASAPEAWWRVADAQCAWWTAAPSDGAAARRPTSCSRRAVGPTDARVLQTRLRNVTRALARRGDDVLADAFIAGAAALAHVRADPLLPAELAPVEPGDDLRAVYREYELAFGRAASAWFRER